MHSLWLFWQVRESARRASEQADDDVNASNVEDEPSKDQIINKLKGKQILNKHDFPFVDFAVGFVKTALYRGFEQRGRSEADSWLDHRIKIFVPYWLPKLPRRLHQVWSFPIPLHQHTISKRSPLAFLTSSDIWKKFVKCKMSKKWINY